MDSLCVKRRRVEWMKEEMEKGKAEEEGRKDVMKRK